MHQSIPKRSIVAYVSQNYVHLLRDEVRTKGVALQKFATSSVSKCLIGKKRNGHEEKNVETWESKRVQLVPSIPGGPLLLTW